MSPDTQICNCNGVSKGQLIACVNSGKRSGKAVMDATRAGMGCGSCKAMVNEIVEWACGGQTEEDPSIHYYVPGVPLTKPELIRAIRRAQSEICIRCLRLSCRRQRRRRQQARPRVPPEDALARRVRRRKGCAVHQ